MATFVEAEVIEVLCVRTGLQKLRVRRADNGDGERAYILTEVLGEADSGDRVVINTTAVDLGLGTGGWHFVHWNLSRESVRLPGSSHQMKMRYTSLQFDTATTEEAYELPATLDGTPVICTELLSQAATAAIVYKALQPSDRIVFVMTDQNALPIAISDLVADLVDKGIVATTITAGQAFGGEHEAVTPLSGLGIAKGVEAADLIVVSPGPGSLGTGSRFGFSTLGIASNLDDAAWYGGSALLGLRYSDVDRRHRHQGISHHSLTILERAHSVIVAGPLDSELPGVKEHRTINVDTSMTRERLEASGIEVSSMGRTYEQDPMFFEYSAAPAHVASEINH